MTRATFRLLAAAILGVAALDSGVGAPAQAAAVKPLLPITGSGDGALPNGLTASARYLYGATLLGGAYQDGCIYRIDPATGAKKIVYSFKGGSDGAGPDQPTAVGDLIYGATRSGGAANAGTIYVVDPQTGTETVLYSFMGGTDGSRPFAHLVDVDGTLYGLTSNGGEAGVGTLFSFDIATGQKATLHDFPQPGVGEALLTRRGNELFGLGEPTVKGDELFRFNIADGTLKSVHVFKEKTARDDGFGPRGPFVIQGDVLYGVTGQGGATDLGTIFQIDLASGKESVDYTFQGGKDGKNPLGGLYAVGDKLYGASYLDDNFNDGMLFSFDPATHTKTVVATYTNGADASYQVFNGFLYSTTSYFSTHGNESPRLVTAPITGSFQAGTVFSVDPSSGQTATLATFNGPLGLPGGGILRLSGVLNLVLAEGGANSLGAIERLDPRTGGHALRTSFDGGTGAYPMTALTDVAGTLYGTASLGGANGCGNIYSFNRMTGTRVVLYDFKGTTDGCAPAGPLVNLNGILYGTTTSTLKRQPVIFSLDPSSGQETTAYSFSKVSEGYVPSLTSAGGSLYGTAVTGDEATGQVFQFTPATATFSVLHAFKENRKDGMTPAGPVTLIGSKLYGATTSGGPYGCGTIYRIDPATREEKILYSFVSDASDACSPNSNLVEIGGTLYGTAQYSYNQSPGKVFAFDLAAKTLSVTYEFTDPAGSGTMPLGLLVGTKSALYGLTSQGGAFGLGAVYQVTP